jgi:hypothetical protein
MRWSMTEAEKDMVKGVNTPIPALQDVFPQTPYACV